MRNAKAVSDAEVFVGSRLAGHLKRHPHGSSFTYDAAFLEALTQAEGGIAFNLPYAQANFDSPGESVHPFFAGLLPEGRRLSSLISRVKTSRDDLFSLLLAAGPDTIGDISVRAPGTPNETPPVLQIETIEKVDFIALLERVLSTGRKGLNDRSIPGVQDKLSAEMISMPLAGSKSRDYILKLSAPHYSRQVENEAYFMKMARLAGLQTAKTRLVKDRNGVSGLLVERFDRVLESGKIRKLHQEDACQFVNRYPADKYRLSAREVADGIIKFSTAKPVALLRFLQLCAYSYLIGNHDFHGKNVSLFVPAPNDVQLTPAYDLLTTLAYPELDEHMPMAMEGKTKNWKSSTFTQFAARYGMPKGAVEDMLDRLCSKAPLIVEGLPEIGFDEKTNKRIEAAVLDRAKSLAPNA